MDAGEMKSRTKAFALRVLRLVDSLPLNGSGRVCGQQLLRSATSVAANYRSALRARSTAEFVSKLGVVEEEADESLFWIEFGADADLVKPNRVQDLLQEANELVSIIVATRKSTRRRMAAEKSEIANRKS